MANFYVAVSGTHPITQIGKDTSNTVLVPSDKITFGPPVFNTATQKYEIDADGTTQPYLLIRAGTAGSIALPTGNNYVLGYIGGAGNFVPTT